MRIALATCLRLPEPDPDQPLLRAALRSAGVSAEMLAWDDPAADLAGFDLCVIRSTWNYYHAPGVFLAWAERAARGTRLLNPIEVIRWNIHKGYLRELAARGVPIVPTEFVARANDERGTMNDEVQRDKTAKSLADIVEANGWTDVVIKPAISAGSWRTRRFHLDGPEARPPRDRPEAGPTPHRPEAGATHPASATTIATGTLADGQAFLNELCGERDAMIQPYLRSVDDGGERALVWIAGAWTHAVTKHPRLSGADESVSAATPLTEEEREFAENALSVAAACVDRADLLYARLDVMRDDAGRLCVSELELIEPSLFFAQHPPALERFVHALRRLAT